MRFYLLPLLLLAACSKGPDTDLPTISEARSLGAEWAMVNEQANKGALTAVYTGTMHEDLREQIQSTAKSLSLPNREYGAEIRALIAEPDNAPPQQLRAHAEKLKAIEDSLESA